MSSNLTYELVKMASNDYPPNSDTKSSSTHPHEEAESYYNINLDETLKKLAELHKVGKLELLFSGNKYGPDIQRIELAKALPVPKDFAKVVTICDCESSGGYAAKTANRASSIFYALASLLFKNELTDVKMANHVKLLYLKQLEREYSAARESNNVKDGEDYLLFMNATIMHPHEPWTDRQWLMASKAFFCPIHVLFFCSRVPYIPHVQRYAFSPVLEKENPIRILIENEEYSCEA